MIWFTLLIPVVFTFVYFIRQHIKECKEEELIKDMDYIRAIKEVDEFLSRSKDSMSETERMYL
jgi:hypothetical protein